jgi:hypothetical protein
LSRLTQELSAALVDFLAINGNVSGCSDPEADAVAFDCHDGNRDATINHYRFSETARENQHDFPP